MCFIEIILFRVIFEVHIESEITVEVKWFKDNLPLNSPDYETRHEGNVASLTIEETFSEDTARYTIRVSNMYGEVESSAYLHVKGKSHVDFYIILSISMSSFCRFSKSARCCLRLQLLESVFKAVTCDFQQCGILTSVDSYETVQFPFKLRNSKCCSVSSLTVIDYSSDLQRL